MCDQLPNAATLQASGCAISHSLNDRSSTESGATLRFNISRVALELKRKLGRLKTHNCQECARRLRDSRERGHIQRWRAAHGEINSWTDKNWHSLIQHVA